jgi:rubrerythrin
MTAIDEPAANVSWGVLSDRPVDRNEGAQGDILIAVDAPSSLVERIELKEQGKPYREFIVQAAVLNAAVKQRLTRVSQIENEEEALLRDTALPALSGSIGSFSFRCRHCGHIIEVEFTGVLPACRECGVRQWDFRSGQ